MYTVLSLLIAATSASIDLFRSDADIISRIGSVGESSDHAVAEQLDSG